MTFRAFQVAESFGALDKAAIEDGASLGAMQARTMARQANRLLKKRHQVLNLMWPVTTTTINDLAQYANESVALPQSSMMIAPCPALKKPGIVGATAYFRVRAGNGMKYALRVGTVAVDRPQSQEVAVTGTGSWQWASVSIALDPGDQERITVYLRADGASGALMNTATYGSPNTGTLTVDDVLGQTAMEEHAGGVTWDTDLVIDGHFIRFLQYGQPVADRQITLLRDHGGHHTLVFDPLTADQFRSLSQRGRFTEVTYEIREMPWIAMAQVLVVTDERTL
jgi:hypothetical protein